MPAARVQSGQRGVGSARCSVPASFRARTCSRVRSISRSETVPDLADRNSVSTDGAAYERYMGKWSQLAGETFLDWLAPRPGLRWLDVGCGNGAFTEMLVERCAPASVDGIDPSEAQLAFARTRPASRVAQFRQGDAHGAAVPRRHVRRGRHAAGDFLRSRPGQGRCGNGTSGPRRRHRRRLRMGYPGGGFRTRCCSSKCAGWTLPFRYRRALTHLGSHVVAGVVDWCGSGGVETREIKVQRTFADFDDYWTTILGGPSVGPKARSDVFRRPRASPERDAFAPARRRSWPHHLQWQG